MSMKKNVIVMLVLACLPLWVVAQNTNDDLYFIPKKKVEKKKEVVETTPVETAGNETTGTPVVVKDVNGNVRDVDEYNRRYTSRDNYFKMENDTLYIEEKPYDERGEWVNGFDGTQSDYEYAMRIIRFRNPYYAIPVSSPLYWDIVYGSPSWEWNVFNDGFYAYAFPTFSNSLWWNWRWSWNWGWGSSWHYGWHRSYWGFDAYWYRPHWHYGYCHPYHHHHHYHHGWAGTGGYWGKNHGWNGSTATRPGIHAGRYKNNYQSRYASAGTSNRKVATGANRNSRDRYVNGVRQNNTRNDRTNRVSSGRVVTAKDATGASSVRPQRSATRNRSNGNVTQRNNNGRNNTYTRPAEGQRSSYTRQSSTRSTSSYQRNSGAAERGAYRSSSSAARSSESRSSYDKSSSSSSSSRSSYSSGSSSSPSRSSSGGGSSRSGGGSRSAGRR